MELFQTIFLALIQGLTEFLPISSSGHLILASQIFGWQDQGLHFDVAVHLGTLAAVVVYFRRDIADLTIGWFQPILGKPSNEQTTLAWAVILATIPAGIVGLLFKDFIEEHLRSSLVIAMTTIVFGLLLWVADTRSNLTKNISQITLRIALIIGCAQAIALIPGTSRSGITITAALLLGFAREPAARFSFLLSIPIITLSAGLLSLDLLDASSVDWQALVIGTVVSGLSAYACIYYFLAFINRLGMLPFVIYRFILGGFLLIWTFA